MAPSADGGAVLLDGCKLCWKFESHPRPGARPPGMPMAEV